MKQTAWYTHDGNSQKGPYSEDDLKTLVIQGKLFPKTFVWKTGMSDWTTWEKVGPELTPRPQQISIASSKPKFDTSNVRVLFAIGIAAVCAIFAPKIWGLAQFELKMLELVRSEDRTAVRETLKKEPFSLSFTKQQENFHSLLFVNNLTPGSWVRMKIDGNSETLLNRLSAHSEMTFQTKSEFDTTPEFRLQDGTLIPAGEYTLKIEVEGQTKPFEKKLFLGSQQDSTYLAKLKEFHSRIQKKAMTEIQENEMYLSSLENQLQSILKKPSKEVLTRWNGFQLQLREALSSSMKSPAKDQLYYPDARQTLVELETTIQAIRSQLPAQAAAILPLETQSRVLTGQIRAKLEEARTRFPLKESKI